MGISDATFYKWRQKDAGLGPSELRKLKQLEEENTKLKRLVADLSLDKAMLQDVLSKKLYSPRASAISWMTWLTDTALRCAKHVQRWAYSAVCITNSP
jgi:putative transposase